MKNTIDYIKNRFANHQPRPMGKHRFFSVLVPFVEKDGKLYLLLELRSSKLKSDPGEICFPGGHVEKGENFQSAALRETAEELGIDEEKIEIIGQGNIMYGYANYTLYTYLGIIKYEDYLNAKISEAEVEEIFLVSFDALSEMEPLVYTEKTVLNVSEGFPYEMLGIDEDYYWRIGKWEIPIYDIDNRMIWGITARIIRDLIMDLEEK